MAPFYNQIVINRMLAEEVTNSFDFFHNCLVVVENILNHLAKVSYTKHKNCQINTLILPLLVTF
jgi:hypothetical protein